MAGTWTDDDEESGNKTTHRPGFDMLPKGTLTDEECTRQGAQVKNRRDTKIQVNWNFSTGPQAGKSEKRWMYFQDGATIEFLDGAVSDDGSKILGTYSSNGDVAASVTPFGKGWVGVVGPHPEATKDWCECRTLNFALLQSLTGGPQTRRIISRTPMGTVLRLDMILLKQCGHGVGKRLENP